LELFDLVSRHGGAVIGFFTGWPPVMFYQNFWLNNSYRLSREFAS